MNNANTAAPDMTNFILDVAECLNECEYPLGPVVKNEEEGFAYFTATLLNIPNVALSFHYPHEFSRDKLNPCCCVNFNGDSNNFMCCEETSNLNRVVLNVGMAISAFSSFSIKNMPCLDDGYY